MFLFFFFKNKRQREWLNALRDWLTASCCSLVLVSSSYILSTLCGVGFYWYVRECLFQCFSCGKLNRDPLFKQVTVRGRLPFSPKFWKFRLEIKWNGPFLFCPTGIFETLTALTESLISVGRSDRNSLQRPLNAIINLEWTNLGLQGQRNSFID